MVSKFCMKYSILTVDSKNFHKAYHDLSLTVPLIIRLAIISSGLLAQFSRSISTKCEPEVIVCTL